jgi:hypothetical protein
MEGCEMSDRSRDTFTATHHALLFAWISREVVERIGVEEGEAVMRAVVRRYGEERGRRMALRALADGQTLSMASFLAHGEWEVGPGQMARQVIEKPPDVLTHVHRCPWHAAWVENDLMEYGRLYCLEIDEALVRGFNPDLGLEVNRTQTNDGEYCEFVYRDVGSGMPKRGAVMPWDYHAGHLYKTAGEVLLEKLGELGREALSAALEEFSERYGQEASRLVVAYWDMDFSCVPG